jgi:phage protein D
LLRPNYVLEVGSEKFTPDSEEGILSLDLSLRIGLPIDCLKVLLVGRKELPFISGDPVKLQLGYDENLVQVFSGLLWDFEHDLSKVRLTAFGYSKRLLELRLNRVYLNQSAGAIVSDLARAVDIEVKECDDGFTFPIYVIDDGANAYEHIVKLARRCGYDAYMTSTGELVFKEAWLLYSREVKIHVLEFGKDILRVEVIDRLPPFPKITFFGESPSSVRGAETYHWLTKREVKGTSVGRHFEIHGTPIEGPVIQDPTIRDSETAEEIADIEAMHLWQRLIVTVDAVGNPEIMLGDCIKIEGFDNQELNGIYQVIGVRHYLSNTRGFVTTIEGKNYSNKEAKLWGIEEWKGKPKVRKGEGL